MQQPFFNSFRPQFPNQNQSNSNSNTNGHAFNQQVFSTNPLQNSMPLQQPQMGSNMANPQIPDPFNATQLGNSAQAVPNLPALMATLQQQQQQQQPGFINPQSNLLGALQTIQSFIGSSPQNQISNLNALWTLMNQMNPCQQQGQSFAPNPNNLPQQFGPNMGFPNFQYPLQNLNASMPLQAANLASYSGNQALGNFPNQFQNTNPAAPVQIPNHASLGSFQALGPQNPNLMANSMIYPGQQVNLNHSNALLPKKVGNGPMPLPIAARQGQGNPPLQNQISQPSALDLQKGNPVRNGQGSTSNPKWKNNSGKNFNNRKTADLQPGYQKSQFRNMRNEKRKLGPSNQLQGGGYGHERAAKFGPIDPANQAVQKKRSLALSYTEEEIKLWLEGRKKNYPTEANIKKKQKSTDSEVVEREAKLRSQQLKEILGKQAELGVEVAEIPSYYLSDSVNQVNNSEDNRRHANRKGRTRNRFDKRGRFNKNDQLRKQKPYAEANSSKVLSFKKREPTLLQKLLSKDVKADKQRLLQVFRFMVMNSFFKDWPEKPLEFPSVTVAGDICKDVMPEERSLLGGEDVSKLANRKTAENLGYDSDADEDDDCHDDDNRINPILEKNENYSQAEEEESGHPMGKCNLVREVPIPEEEEGEIVD